MAKVKMVISQTAQITQKLTKLKSDMIFSSVLGNYNDYKTAKKAYAELAKDNFELAKKAAMPKIDKIPIFSKTGMRIMKVWLLEKFRIKTPAEKELIRLTNIEKAKQKFNIQG